MCIVVVAIIYNNLILINIFDIRVHRSYQALNFGYSQDALVDMTGGIGEFIDLHGAIGVRVCEDEEQKVNNITKLFKRLKRLEKKKCSFMCTAINVSILIAVIYFVIIIYFVYFS